MGEFVIVLTVLFGAWCVGLAVMGVVMDWVRRDKD